MKITASNSQLVQQKINTISDLTNNQVNRKDDSVVPSFSERLDQGLNQVAETQNEAAKLARNFELGVENDLARVMVGQQVSSLAFQLMSGIKL